MVGVAPSPEKSSAPLNSGGRYAHIDALRAAAVMLVVVAHAGLGDIVPGGAGVTIFFAISGFVITWVTLRELDRSGGFDPIGFYSRRIWKLAPPLVAALIIPTVIYALWNEIDWGAFASQLFFVFNWTELAVDGPIDVLPGSHVVWSLAIEEQFYIGFALLWLLAVRARRPLAWLTGLAVTAVVVSTALRFVFSDGTLAGENRVYYGTDTRLDGIALGILTALIVHRGLSAKWGHPGVLIGACGALGLSLVIRSPEFRDTLRFTVQSLATCAVIAYGFAPRTRDWLATSFHALSGSRPVQLLGRASYSIYLCHFGIILAIAEIAPDLSRPVSVTLGVLLGTAVGVACYQVVEVPVANWRAGRKRVA